MVCSKYNFIDSFYFISGQSLGTFKIVSNVFNYFISFTGTFISPKIYLHIIGQVWFSYFMIYRAYLFETLSTSNRRKRIFMKEL